MLDVAGASSPGLFMEVHGAIHVVNEGRVILRLVKVYPWPPLLELQPGPLQDHYLRSTQRTALNKVWPFFVQGFGCWGFTGSFALFWAFRPQTLYGAGSCSTQGGFVLGTLTFASPPVFWPLAGTLEQTLSTCNSAVCYYAHRTMFKDLPFGKLYIVILFIIKVQEHILVNCFRHLSK